MSFYGPEPFDIATATYIWTGLGGPGAFIVEVAGNAPRVTSHIALVRDPHFVGGLRVHVMGWTGPIIPGTQPYRVSGTFPGAFLPKIIVTGSNKTVVVEVKQIQHEEAENYLKSIATA